uniref:F-box domain-containing protein n=1 Tax=Mycena chlorophos TaxID=658473 RepID=A0ABQ0LKD7_MYCCL|nr:predicted protein [Mycena chlorophos]
MSTHDEPFFPPELERKIFEEAAYLHAALIPVLLLVAQRVFLWMEPLMYRTLTVRDHLPQYERFLEIFLLKSPAFLTAAVRHIHFDSSAASINTAGKTYAEILARCPGITHVGTTVVFTGPRAREALTVLPNLTHLTTNLNGLFPDSKSVNPRHAILANVTHLNLHDSMAQYHARENIWDAIPYIPRLTHLRMKSSGLEPTLLEQLLESCPNLHVLLLTTGKSSEAFTVLDPRLVWGYVTDHYDLFWEDWMRNVRGEVDMWLLAEEMVQRRTLGQASMNEIEWIRLSHWPAPSRPATDTEDTISGSSSDSPSTSDSDSESDSE